jgi:hypothetical protein
VRLRVYLFASAVFILTINAAPLPAATPASVNLASVDACSLLTQAEVSAAVGAPMTIGRHDPGTTQSCSWSWIMPSSFQPQAAPPPIILSLRLAVGATGPMACNRIYFVGSANVTSVSGLGDDAYYAQIGNSQTVLDVKKGGICVHISWLSAQDDSQTVMDGERSIAAQVLSEL